MCCFNSAPWVGEAIESVLLQTFCDFELIIVDDGSVDDTRNILERYAKRDGRVRVFHKGNSGLTDSLNFGIKCARGRWIARIDADDICISSRLARQSAYMDTHPDVLLLGSGFIEMNAQGHESNRYYYPKEHGQLMGRLIRLRGFFPHSSSYFRRDVVCEMGGYNWLFRKSQDRELWLRFGERGRIACLQEPLVAIRRHEAQISQSPAGISQLVYSVSAATCHFLRARGYADPSRDVEAWGKFVAWLEAQSQVTKLMRRRRVWGAARVAYFANPNPVRATLQLAWELMASGYGSKLLAEKLSGSSVPRKLADLWANQC